MANTWPARSPLRSPALVQGIYFFTTGVWPLIHRASFEAVTGPKVDYWLVETVGILVAVIGLTLLAAIRTHTLAALPIALLAIGSAAGLMVIDVVYASLGRIPPVYLLDAALEVGLISWWLIALWRARPESSAAH